MRKASLLIVWLWLAGCAGAPTLPSGFDAARSTISRPSGDAVVVIDGASGKLAGAAGAGAKGGGVGLGVGLLGCLGTGLLAPLCWATVVPATTAIGAASGAVVGAVRSESADRIEAKRELLRKALADSAAAERLAAGVRERVAGRHGAPAAADAAAPWQVEVRLSELVTVGGGPDKPYALRAAATVELRRPGAGAPLFVKAYPSRETAARTAEAWAADGARQTLAELDMLVAQLADAIADDLLAASGR